MIKNIPASLCLIITTLLFNHGMVHAQGASTVQVMNTADALKTLPTATPEVKGTTYLDEEWALGSIEIKPDTKIDDLLIRYDLEREVLEIKLEEEVKICPLIRLEHFSFLKNKDGQFRYYNTAEINNVAFDIPKGICRVLVNDNLTLVKYIFIEKVASSYNLALSMGTPGEKILKKEMSYAILDDKVFEVSGSFKRNSEIFENEASQMKSYVKENKLKFKTDKDLIQIFEHYNSLL